MARRKARRVVRRTASRAAGYAGRRAPSTKKIAGFAVPFLAAAGVGYAGIIPEVQGYAPMAATVGFAAGVPVLTELGLGVMLGQQVRGLLGGVSAGGAQTATGGYNL